MIENLKNYNITQPQAGFYDVESGTVLQQTARLYQKMEEIIDITNDKINEMNNGIDYMKNNIEETTNEIFNNYLEEEKIKADIKINYNSTTEELTLSIIESKV